MKRWSASPDAAISAEAKITSKMNTAIILFISLLQWVKLNLPRRYTISLFILQIIPFNPFPRCLKRPWLGLHRCMDPLPYLASRPGWFSGIFLVDVSLRNRPNQTGGCVNLKAVVLSEVYPFQYRCQIRGDAHIRLRDVDQAKFVARFGRFL